MTPSNTFVNDVPFGSKDYRVYCGSQSEGWERLDMQKRRVDRLSISLQGFFNSTYKSQINSVLYADKINSKGTYYPVLVTLTYKGDNEDWDSKDISKLVDNYRKDWKQRLGRDPAHFRYVWVAELQKRGVIHYHLVLWCPRGKSLMKPDQGWWTKGASNIVGVRKGVVGYLSKYLSKGSSGVDSEGSKVYFPKGCRIFGMGGLSLAERSKIAYKKLPRYVRGLFEYGEKVLKVVGGYKQGVCEIVSPYTFKVLSFEPQKDPYSSMGWTGGRLTCILIEYERKFVILSDKEEYLKDVSCEK